jgi:hypothetical protein
MKNLFEGIIGKLRDSSDEDHVIRMMVGRGILPNAPKERILQALRRTREKNVVELFGFLSARQVAPVQRDLGLLSCKKVTVAFANYLVDSMQNSTTTPMSNFKYHGTGTGNNAESNADTALITEVESRVTGNQTEGANANIYKSVGTVTYTANRTIWEHGLFSASANGSLCDRSVLVSGQAVQNNDQIEWTYELTVNAES